MICRVCGGRVEWQGPLTNLTHTKCLSCGAENSQICEGVEPPEFEKDDREEVPF